MSETIHCLFERQVDSTPDAIAFLGESGPLTYLALERRANRLAHRLVDAGIQIGSIVAIHASRPDEVITALLAVLKAGGVYLALDTSAPSDRVSLILDDCEPAAVIVGSQADDRISTPGLVSLAFDTASEERDHSSDRLATRVSGTDVAYLMYTSGSTGRPKGVLIGHAGLCNLVREQASAFCIGEGTRVLQFAAFSVDASVAEWATALASGATLCLMSAAVETRVGALLQALRHYQPNVLTLPPSVLLSLSRESLRCVETLIVAGEMCPDEVIREWAHEVRLLNAYGPTEATVCATTFLCRTDKPAPTIGKALGNVTLHVIDDELRSVAVGEIGELCIGGIGVAVGYLGRPELDREKFISLSSDSRGTRVYRTGDLVRVQDDGNLEFVGRRDEQLKIFGHRIEPGEIEAYACEYPGVRQCVVVAQTDAAPRDCLTAYYIGDEVEASVLDRHLRNHLPGYMVPMGFEHLEAFPLTISGKLDRHALTETNPKRQVSRLPGRQGDPDVKSSLLQIWQKLLPNVEIGVDQSFFALGGDSILAIQMIADASEVGIELAVEDVFETPTIGALSKLALAPAPSMVEEAPVIIGGGRADELTPIVHWFFDQDFANVNHYNQSVLLELSGPLSLEHLEQILDDICEHHDALRIRFDRSPDGKARSRVLAPGYAKAACRELDLTGLGHSEAIARIEEEAEQIQAQLDISKGPAVRATLVHSRSIGGARVLLAIHHLFVDMVSWRILIDRFEALYRGIQSGDRTTPTGEATSFPEWAQALRAYGQSHEARAAAKWWLDNTPAQVARVRIDHDRGPNCVKTARSISVQLSVRQTDVLLHRAPNAYRSHINDLLLAALVSALSDLSDGEGLYLDLEGHGREAIIRGLNLSRSIGWFTSLFPLHLRKPGRGGLPVLIKQVKEVLRSLPHHGADFGIVRYLATDEPIARDLASLPLPEISFNYLGQQDRIVRPGGFVKRCHTNTRNLIGPDNIRPHLIDISGEVSGGRLGFQFVYSANHFTRDTILGATRAFVAALTAVIDHCSDPSAFGYTPSDFPLAPINQAQLDGCFGHIEGVEDIYPLTPLQQGLLHHSIEHPADDTYFVQSVMLLRGEVVESRAEEAWRRVVAAHPVLRTGFAWRKLPEPLQYVVGELNPEWATLDWTAADSGLQREQLSKFLGSDRERRFPSLSPGLSRVTCIRLDSDRRWLVWSHLHLIVDGSSDKPIWNDFLQAYTDIAEGTSDELPDRRAFRDLVAWRRLESTAASEEFWKTYLRDVRSPLLAVPSLSSSSVAQPSGGYLRRELDESVTFCFQQFARDEGLTLNTLLQGAWALLISGYTQEQETVHGIVVSGRTVRLKGIESMSGLLIDTVPLRARIAPGCSVRDFLGDLQTAIAKIITHSRTPLAKLQRWAGASPRARLFDSIVGFESIEVESPTEVPGEISLERLFSVERTEYPLSLAIRGGRTISLDMRYDERSFDPGVVDRMARHFEDVLRAFLSDPEQDVAGIEPWLQRQELDSVAPAHAEVTIDCDHLVHRLFEEHARCTPDATAIICDDESWTYAQTNLAADRVASSLIRLGVRPDTIVGVWLGRSPTTIASLLGVMKSGAAYLPLDPRLPMARLRYFVEASGARTVLTEGTRGHELASSEVNLVNVADAIANEQDDFPMRAAVAPEHLAYVMFTSGSTGKPKGVMVEHRSLANLMLGQRSLLSVGPSSRVLHIASIGFDASVWEWSTALSNGAALCIVRERDMTGDLETSLRRLAPTVALIVPSLLNTIDPEALEALETLVVGGEPCSTALLHTWRSRVRVVNAYGPTEATVYCCAFDYDADHVPTTIGSAIPNAQLDIVGKNGDPVPIGAAGELCVSGEPLARGYIDSSGDQAGFSQIPHAAGAPRLGRRIYRTGDRARMLPDGNIEYLGRLDEQVKIRGQRLEPIEVEQELVRHPAVTAAAVVQSRPDLAVEQLVAFICSSSETPPSSESLREHCARALPRFMIPSRFEFVDSLPQTPGGKLDRQVLVSRAEALRRRHGESAESANSTEATLSSIWSEVLGLQGIGIDDDFIELGGDSILAILVTARAEEQGLRLNTHDVFEARTIRDLAGRAEEVIPGPDSIGPSHSGRRYPLLPAQEEMSRALLVQPKGESAIVQNVIEFEGSLSYEHLRRAWEQVTEKNDALRSCFNLSEDGVAEQHFELGVELRWNVEDWTGWSDSRADAELEHRLQLDRSSAFDPARAPLMRWQLLTRSGDRHTLIWSYHHIVLDAWSRGVVLDAVASHYRVLEGTVAPHAEPRRVRVTSLSQHIQDSIHRDDTDARSFYRGMLADRERAFDIVKSLGAERDARSSSFDSVGFVLDRALSGKLDSLSRQSGVTPSALIVASWLAFLRTHFQVTDVTIGLAVTGRTSGGGGDLNLVGMLANMLPARFRLVPEMTFGRLLSDVTSQIRIASRYEHVPARRIRQWIGVPHDQPLFDVPTMIGIAEHDEETDYGEARIVSDRGRTPWSGQPMGLMAVPGQRMRFKIGFDLRLLSFQQADEMAASFRRGLVALLDADESGSLPLSQWMP